MIAGAATDTIGHCMTLVTKFFKLFLVVLIHAVMKAQGFVGIGDRRELDGCFLST